MSTTPSPLPDFPFPVYGLGPDADIDRAVDVWNRLGNGTTDPLWYIALTHTGSSATATVITDGRLDTGTSRQHTALADVAQLVLLGHVSSPDSDLSLKQVSALVETAGEPPWQTESFTVDGEPHPFSTYRSGDFVAAYADLGQVVVGFYGLHADQLVDQAQLQAVNSSLHSYTLPPVE